MKSSEPQFTPLTGKTKRRKFLVLDLESKDDDSQKAGFTRPFLAGVYDGKDFQAFRDQDPGLPWHVRWYWPGGCVDRMMRHILSRKYSGWHIYAHNAGKFDYLFLLPWLMFCGELEGYTFRLTPVASTIQILDIRKGGKRWRFLDSLRLIPMGLDKAARTFAHGGKLEHDLHLHEDDTRWEEYNRVDCVRLYQVLTSFHHYVENVLCGEVGVTAPSTALKVFRRNYLPKAIDRNIDTHEFVRAGYFGGRVEVFRRHGEKLRYYDINSSYPAAMLDSMPGSHCIRWEGEPEARMNDRIGFCEVDIHVPEHLNIPPLPVRGTGEENLPKGKLLFPVGKLRGIWEWGELQQALSMGCEIVRWRKSVWYESIDFFSSFVRELYSFRDKSRADYNEGMALIAKLLLNSTYGKFGMKTERRKIYRYDDSDLPDDAIPAGNHPEALIWYSDETVDAPYVMPQIAARVTALARVRLLRFALEAEKRGGPVHYMDTDSLLTTATMPTGSELGALKDEHPEQSGQITGEFLGPKLYLLTGPGGLEKVKAKGMQKRNREVFEALAAGKAVVSSRLEKVGTLAKDNFKRGPRMVHVPKRLLPEHGKRQMNSDGTTRPYIVDMWGDKKA